MKIDFKYTLPALIDHSVKSFPNNNSLLFVDQDSYTFKQMGDDILRVMQMLTDIGIKQGDRVAIFSTNMPNWGITYFAIAKLGAVVVPILPDFKPKELSSILEHSEAKALFISSGLFNKLNAKDFKRLNKVILINNFAFIDFLDIDFEDLTMLESDLPQECNIKNHADVKESDLASIIYTSGTTGSSKGVMLSHKNLVWTAVQSYHVEPLTPQDRMLSILPLSHAYENTIGFIFPILFGSTIYYLRKPPVAPVLLPALKKVKPTHMLAVPMIIEKIYRGKIVPEFRKKLITRILYAFKPTRKLLHKIAGKKLYQTFGGKLRFFGVGGAKLSPDVEKFLRDAKFPYAIGYGLTETSPLLAGGKIENIKLGSTGKALEGVQIRLADINKKTKEGEVQVCGENVMLGYYKSPELTAEVMTEDGWFRTGDKGKFDKQKRLYIKGRIKTMIVGANGENIYPEEIESVINKMRYVVESLVIEKKGNLVAMIHLNLEEIDKNFQSLKKDAHELKDRAHEYYMSHIDPVLNDIHKNVNQHVNKFSRIQKVFFQPIPFEKTPTKKIKRFLYSK